MTALLPSIKTLSAFVWLVLALVMGPALPGEAASFTMKRGLNLDMWTTWPDEDRWGDAAVILPFPEWRKSLAEADLARLKADGFDFLRMPVDPAPFLSDKTQKLRERLYASVLASARMVNRAGLKVVVDLHLVPSGAGGGIGAVEVLNDARLFDAYLAVVREMALTLSGEDPAMVALEPMNEPVLDCEGTDLWPDRLRRLHAAARAAAGRLTLVLGGACYSSAEALERLDPRAIADDNVIWTFHSYTPFLLTHQGATWAGDFIPYVTGLPYPLDAVPRAELDAAVAAIRERIEADAPWSRRAGLLAYLDEQIAEVESRDRLDALMDAPFEKVAAWAQRNGVAAQDITLGEFGMIRQEYGNPHVVPPRHRAAYVRDMIARAEARGFSWSLWSYGGAFGVVEAFGGDRAEPDVLEAIRELPPARR